MSEFRPVLAVDVCGTLYDENTTSGFVIYHLERNCRFWQSKFLEIISGRRKVIPFLISRLGKVLGIDLHRSLVLRMIEGEDSASLKCSANEYCFMLDKRCIAETHSFLKRKKEEGWRPILVSNSIDLVIEAIARKLEVEFVSSKLLWNDDICTGRISVDLTGRKRRYLEEYLDLSLANIDFSVVTDNKTDADLIVAAKHAYLVVCGQKKTWMEKYDAEFIYFGE